MRTLSDTSTATVRTAVPAAWSAAVVWAAARLGITLTPTEVAVAVPIVLGVLYRAGRELEARWPVLGRILFGSPRTPTYPTSTPEG
jgi:hypothetical protein